MALQNMLTTFLKRYDISTATIVLLLLTPLPLILSYIELRYRRHRAKLLFGCLPIKVYAPWDMLFGLDLIIESIYYGLKGEFLEYSHRRFEKYGPTFGSKHIFFSSLHTNDPQNIKQILSGGFENWVFPRNRLWAMTPLFGRGIFTNDGTDWSHSRGILRPCFSKKKLLHITAILDSHFERLLSHLTTESGTAVDLQSLFLAYTLDTSTEFLFGNSMETLKGTIVKRSDAITAKDFIESFTTASLEIPRRMMLGPLQVFRYSATADAARIRARKFIDQYVSEVLNRTENDRKEIRVGEYELFGELATAIRDPVRLRDEILNILLASRDTTGSLLANLFFYLARKPEIWARIRDEVQLLGSQPLTLETVMKRLPYIRSCIRESLRIHPVVPVNAREAACDTTLPRGGGPDGNAPIFVRQGTQVSFNIWSLHRRKSVYGMDVNEFRPERWHDLKEEAWNYLPFNAGPRICLGKEIALFEAGYVTARMARDFEAIRPQDSRPWTEFYTLVVRNRHGTLVSLERIKNGERAG